MQRYRMPDEGRPHQRTWMAFGASEQVWTADLLPLARRALADIARTIARFEPVSMLVRPQELAAARTLVGPDIELLETPLDDLWLRDSGPVFVVDESGARAGIDCNFNGWGDKQEHAEDALVASFITARAGAEAVHTELVWEGGGIEVDGAGLAIITESCVLNDNRNPGWTKPEVEQELERLLGVEKIIWLPGIAGRDITNGHTDFYARFARPGVVVAGLENDPDAFDYEVTRTHLDILKEATDQHGRPLQIEVIEGPDTVRSEWVDADFAAGYINFYLCNGGVIAPQFGDTPRDAAAKSTLQRLYPDREVVQLNIDAIAAGGGGIHCTTQQEPRIG
ncbi:agmatine deiminase family protein [Nocardia sp. SYP-A9097]|nr:agmatine deiminase family protein [Nocardia sp. SYP-A9097]